MPLEKLERLQTIPATLEEAWDFYSRPDNLASIIPPWLGFQVTSPPEDTMYAGMIITYTIKPLLGVPLQWVTEITHCHEPAFFVDDQRIGPYRFWHHQHLFRKTTEGVEVRDLVHYQLPLGLFGSIASSYVRRRLETIFDYRHQVVQTQFRKVVPP